jgi:chromosome segregation protein
LLKLKKVQILGFKSFCDRTELKFHGEGIAAVVGPNGCGKSNISDAISWVLGEQSAKSLRGVKMEDVIFAGTRDRKPTGMAEVSLTLIEPAVYEGDVNAEPEIEIKDELPMEDDWDEAAMREAATQDTEEAVQDAQPGQVYDEQGNLVTMPAPQEDGLEGTEDKAPLERETPEPQPADAASPAAPAVVLKIRRRKFKQQFKAGEIVVTRRLFRSGDSEYLLNGKLCRLRDIQDIFMGTGLGPESYAIIEQGRIGQILSSKPHDRRAIIEEAAGITKFKTKKRLAELKLEQAKQNLARVNDIFEEITRQMNSLKRQAAKAERYAKLRDEMREKLRVVLASKFAQLSVENAQLEQEIAAHTASIEQGSELIAGMEAEHEASTQRGYALESDARVNRDRLNELALEIDRSTARQRNNEERCAELDARSAAGQAELERTKVQLESLHEERAANRTSLWSAASDVARAKEQAEARQREADGATQNLRDCEHEQEVQRTSLLAMISGISNINNQIAQAEENISSLDRDAERLERESTAAMAEIEAMGGRRGQLTMEWESLSENVTGLSARIAEVRSQIDEKRTAERESRNRLDSLRAEYATALGRRNSLEAVIAEHGYSTESVKRLLKAGVFGEGKAPVGVLADFLEVDNQYENVVDDFLREELNYIVVKSWDTADEGMRLLKSDVDGRATFLVHPNDSQAKFSFAVDEATRSTLGREAVVPLTHCIRVLNGFGKSLEVILPKLRDGYIAPDSLVARELALENPNAFFLAPSGETFHNVTVTGGKQRAEGPLSLKRELRELARTVEELERALRNEETGVHMLGRELQELLSLLEDLQDEKHAAEKSAHSSDVTLKQMESELLRTEQRLNGYRLELDRVRQQRESRRESVAGKRDELTVQEERRRELEVAMTAAQMRLSEWRAARDHAAQVASETAAQLAVMEERRRAAAATLERIESLAREVAGRIDILEKQIISSAAEKTQRLSENQQIAERLVTLTDDRASHEGRANELQQASEQLRASIAALDAQLKAARIELDAARDRRGEISAAAAKLKSDMEYMAETCLNELSITAEVLLADQSVMPLEGEALAQSEHEYREMRTRLENMGPVNMMALDEYKETAQRHEFLETQRKDLLDSIENTQNTIKEIDVVSRQKFEEAFASINENFQITFRKLFGGGQGFMRLTDIENSSESGIDIVASPPGKKLQNVLLLSGGEKALTALALLVGIFQYQPSPFCILDEVDAPLDEANVGRFNDLIREMSDKTQFIVITHSKRTMSVAPVMYGVTMQEPGVSKVVSVRFGEEQARTTAASA